MGFKLPWLVIETFNDQPRQARIKARHTLCFVLLKAYLGWLKEIY